MNEYMNCWALVYASAIAAGYTRGAPEQFADAALQALREREKKGMFAAPAPKSYREAPDAFPYPDAYDVEAARNRGI